MWKCNVSVNMRMLKTYWMLLKLKLKVYYTVQCHRLARLFHHPITTITFTGVLTAHTSTIIIKTPSSAHTSLHWVSGLVSTIRLTRMLFKPYTERLTLCLLQCVFLLLAPVSVPYTISLWMLSLLLIRGVCYLQSPFHDLLRNKVIYSINPRTVPLPVPLTCQHHPPPLLSIKTVILLRKSPSVTSKVKSTFKKQKKREKLGGWIKA